MFKTLIYSRDSQNEIVGVAQKIYQVRTFSARIFVTCLKALFDIVVSLVVNPRSSSFGMTISPETLGLTPSASSLRTLRSSRPCRSR